MRSLRFAVAAAALIATTAIASPSDPKNGAEFTTLAAPQPTQTVGKKVEVIEFFAYHCPACNLMEPFVAQFVKRQAANVNFRRIAFPFTGPNDPEAHLFLTLEAMGKSEEYGPKVFHTFHVERQRLTTDQSILDWVAKSGLDKAKFTETWSSFGVMTKLRRQPQLVELYKIDGTPTFVVDGRFLTSPSTVGTSNPAVPNTEVPNATIAVLDALVARVAKEKGASAPAEPAKAATPAKAAAPAPAAAKKTAGK